MEVGEFVGTCTKLETQAISAGKYIMWRTSYCAIEPLVLPLSRNFLGVETKQEPCCEAENAQVGMQGTPSVL